MKNIDRSLVKHIAHLSRLELDEKEIDLYSSQLTSILSYIDKLNQIDTEKIPPTSHALATLKNVFRKDAPKQSISPEQALLNAPQKEGGFFKVPQIIEGK